MGAGLLFQGKKGLRKPQVQPCFGVPKQLHSARMLVVLLLNDFQIWSSQSREGEGGESSCKQRPVFLMLRVCLVLSVWSFYPVVCTDKTSSQLWNREHLGLRSCSTGGWISSPGPWLGCSTAVPEDSTPHRLRFSTPSPVSLDTPSAIIHCSPPKRQVIPPVCLSLPLETRSEVLILWMKWIACLLAPVYMVRRWAQRQKLQPVSSRLSYPCSLGAAWWLA